ncbi:hypothetical protein GGF40_002816 [Coemansia sp. RSA 1286]|nr:hypothetical protein GGF40_002816 [Coemansia sp. RSA 1286]
MTDYFELVADGLQKPPSLAEIENGLEIATRDVANHMGEHRHQSECTKVLMDRFVYSDSDRCSDKATSLALGILKIFGRQINNSLELTSSKAIGALLELAKQMFQKTTESKASVDSCEEALTCVANSMLQRDDCRPRFSQCGGFEVIAEIIQSEKITSTIAFLCGRCLLLALVSNEDARYLVEELDMPVILAHAVRMYLDCETGRNDDKQRLSEGRFSYQQVMAELLKAGMSLCVLLQRSTSGTAAGNTLDDSIPEKHVAKFLELLRVSLDVACALPITSQGHLTDASKQAFSIALNFSTKRPKAVEDMWLPGAKVGNGDNAGKCDYVYRIYSLFEQLIAHVVSDDSRNADIADLVGQYQAELTPVTLVLLRLVAEHLEIRKQILCRVYPEDTRTVEVEKLPEERSGISAKLVRLLRIPQGGMLPGAVGDLLLALMSQDVKQFIMAVGYGNAAGYMLARGIDIPEDVLQQVAGAGADQVPVDPVTGRAFDQEAVDRELAAMTDEEKEREAERLFVLFERLNKTGIIKVENPVRMATQSGRFEEELSDTDDRP